MCAAGGDGAANGMILLLCLYENLISPSNNLTDYCGHERLNIGFCFTAKKAATYLSDRALYFAKPFRRANRIYV